MAGLAGPMCPSQARNAPQAATRPFAMARVDSRFRGNDEKKMRSVRSMNRDTSDVGTRCQAPAAAVCFFVFFSLRKIMLRFSDEM